MIEHQTLKIVRPIASKKLIYYSTFLLDLSILFNEYRIFQINLLYVHRKPEGDFSIVCKLYILKRFVVSEAVLPSYLALRQQK